MKELRVLISDKEAGTLSQDRTGRCHFSDDLSWQRSAASVPLSLSMPLTATDHRPAAVEPFMWGLLPDNQETLARWGRTLDVNPRNPFALLSTHASPNVMGLAQQPFCPPNTIRELVPLS